MNIQLNIFDRLNDGEVLRNAGLSLAVEHADGVAPGWSQLAYDQFTKWLLLKIPGRTFKIEDFRVEMEKSGTISKPPSSRAYGSISVRAAREGLIRKAGYAQVSNPKAHRTPCTLWEVV